MISRGSYYRRLEGVMGAGVTLAFGTEVAETTWTKVLPKEGEKFDTAIEHLKRTNLYPLAQQYEALRTRLISYQLQRLEAVQEILTQSQNTELGVRAVQQRWIDDENLSADMMLDCVDVYNGWA